MKKILSLFTAFIMVFALVGCGGSTGSKSVELKIGRTDYAAHGTKSFAIATVALEGDKILDVNLDEYQYMAASTNTGHVNSEGMASNVVEDIVLGSKRINNDTYSGNMAEKGGATIEIAEGLDMIQDFAKGKTVAELEAAIKGKSSEEVIDEDIVAGSTLVDTLGYIEAIIAAAKEAQKATAVTYSGDASKLTLNTVEYAAHGTKSFALTSVLTDGTTIAVSYIDEYQYMATGSTTSLANVAGEGMSANVVGENALGSKRVNNKFYSGNMAEKGGATIEIAEGLDMIQDFANGKKITDLSDAIKGKSAEEVLEEDIVAGSTLVDTLGYIESILAAAKK